MSLQEWQVLVNTESNLTGPRFELQTYRSVDERDTARPTGRKKIMLSTNLNIKLFYNCVNFKKYFIKAIVKAESSKRTLEKLS